MRDQIVFYLNGKRHEVSGEKAGWMLADYLRYERSLVGTKIVCAEGDCGACSLLRYFPRPGSKGPASFVSINSCIATVAQMDGSSLVTVEALSASETSLSPVQKAMAQCHGSQCGFCTPGFVVALTDLVEKKLGVRGAKPIEKQEAKNALTGNLCRCTGYEPILDAATSLDLKKCESVRKRYWSPEQDRDLKKVIAEGISFETDAFSFFAPRSLKEASTYLKKSRSVRVLAAGTDLGVVHNKRKLRLESCLSLHLIPDLYEIKMAGKSRVRVGARVTLTEVREFLKDRIPEFARFLDLFASPQIKNVATLVGNVCNASPIADTPPFLLATNGSAQIFGPKGKRSVKLEDFYLGYRKTALKPGEFVAFLEFDLPSKEESLRLYKVSQRKDLDISTVNAAFRVEWHKDQKGEKISELRIAMGGMAATPVRLKKTEKILRGAKPDPALLMRALDTFHSEMTPLSDLRGSAAFRRVASENLFRKFFHESGVSF